MFACNLNSIEGQLVIVYVHYSFWYIIECFSMGTISWGWLNTTVLLYSLTVMDAKMQAWQEEVERARQGQRDAEGKLSSLEVSVLCFLPNSFVMINFLIFVFWIYLPRSTTCFYNTYWYAWFQAEMQKMRVEMAAMKRDAEHYSRQVISALSLSKIYNEFY